VQLTQAVLDASSAIIIAKIEAIADWQAIYGPLGIPPVVYEETVVRGKATAHDDALVLEAAIDKGIVALVTLTQEQEEFVKALRSGSPVLGLGECQAIAYARYTPGCLLIIEERKGRAVARAHGVPYTVIQMCPLEGYIRRKLPYRRCLDLLDRVAVAMNTDLAVLNALKAAAQALADERGERNG
jgi:predicted nucleic acid-binding protein